MSLHFLGTLIVVSLLAGRAFSATEPTPPAQPASGPGGSDYAFARVGKFATGTGHDDVMIFWPEQPAPTGKLPLVIFTHGWGAMDPVHYEAWIDHIVRKGAIVLYPRYQESLRVKPDTFTANAVAGVRRGLDWLAQRKDGAQPDLDCVANVGHSAGGVIAANLAVALPAAKLPAPKAVMSVEPGVTRGPKGTLIPLADLHQLDSKTLLLVVTGEDDALVGDKDARRIFEEATALPTGQKDWVELQSDDHGEPALVATHRAPAAPLPGYEPPQRKEPTGFLKKRVARRAKEKLADKGLDLDNATKETAVTDALDYYGTWRLFDLLRDAAFESKKSDVTTHDWRAPLSMGKWSDGTPVKPLKRRAN